MPLDMPPAMVPNMPPDMAPEITGPAAADRAAAGLAGARAAASASTHVVQSSVPPAPATIAQLQSSSLPQLVHAELERMILSGECAPGAKLTEMALAARLGVSRGPLREAFRTLEEAGLVRTEKNRGVFVRDVPLDEAIEIFDLRIAMEEWVGRRLAERIDAAALAEIRALVDAMEQLGQAGDVRAYHLANLRFHDRLVELAGNRKLTTTYRRLIKELSLFRRMNLAHLAEGGQLPLSAGEHREIVTAIAAGDALAAGRALAAHAAESKARMIGQHQDAAPVPELPEGPEGPGFQGGRA
jgi:phosphonate utilization transcriptional regulator